MILTIFTPTYNRGTLLKRVFNSLLKQTENDFEWLIIDDGSSDNTKQIVNDFYSDAVFPIRYYKKINGGKHTAHNMAVNLAQGKYFVCLDSDDYLADNAIINVIKILEKCSSDEGIIAYKADEKGNLLSDRFPIELAITNTVELTSFYQCGGEFTLIYPTSVLKNNLFPVFEGERFITECVLYDRLSNICKMWLLPKVICVCEYQENGYSNNLNIMMKNNPAGYCLYFMQRIDLQLSRKDRVVYAGKYHCFKWFAKLESLDYNGTHKVLVMLCKPIGVFFGLYYKLFRDF